MRRLVDSAVFKLGAQAPEWLRSVEFAATGRHSMPFAATSSASTAFGVDDGPMTYSRAAELLGCSRRTISRYVARGRLECVGRQITALSVAELARGAR